MAQLTVSAALPITHQVEVRPIIVTGNEGRATFFGSAAAEQIIKQEVDAVWAQLGVQILWDDPVEYQDDYTYDGSNSSYYGSTARPQSHLGVILDRASSPPKHPNVKVINMFFVEIVPGFNRQPENAVNGFAFVDRDGTAIHIGSDLVRFRAGLEAVASVVAHEIGHCLGLPHASTSSNLMYSGARSAYYLTSSQVDRMFTNHAGIDGFDFLDELGEYESWAAPYHVGNAEDDDDGDGKTNGYEFMAGTDPSMFTVSEPPLQTPDGPVWSFVRNPEAIAAGYNYRIMTGPDIGNMLDAGASGSGSTIVSDDAELISVRLDTSAGPRGFLSVDLTLPGEMQAEEASALMAAEEVELERVVSACVDSQCQHVIRVDLPDRIPSHAAKVGRSR